MQLVVRAAALQKSQLQIPRPHRATLQLLMAQCLQMVNSLLPPITLLISLQVLLAVLIQTRSRISDGRG